MLKGKKVASKTNTPIVEDSTSSEEDNPSVAVEEIQKSASPTMRSKSALKDSTPISSPAPSVPAEEIRKSTGPKTRSKRSLEDSTSDSVPETSNTSPVKKKSKTSKTSNPPKKTSNPPKPQKPSKPPKPSKPSTSVKRKKNTNKPYRSGFNAINEFVNKYLEKDGDVIKKDRNKVWFTEFQLEKQKESPFCLILDVFVHKKAERKEEENSEKKKEKKRDLWFKSPKSILKIVNQFRHDNSGNNVFVFNTAEEKKFVEVESMPEDLFLIFELKMVASEPVEGECTKTRAEQRYGSLINRLKLKDQSKLGKLDVENEILRIMKLNPKLDMEIERNVEDLVVLFAMYLCITVFFTTTNGSGITKSQFAPYFESLERMKKTNWPVHIHKYLMDSIRKHVATPLRVNGCMVYLMTPSNEQGFPRFLRWVISDISNTIEKDIGEAMKKMQPGWVKAWSDEQQQIMEEYRKNRQESSIDVLKEKLYKALQQRDEALEELSDLQVKHQKLVSFIEEKSKKIYAANLKNVQNDKDVVDLVVDSLQEIISFNKELKTEDERDDDEQEEEEGEKDEKSGKGDVDDSDDDDDEESDKGNRSGKDGDVDDIDKEQEEEGDEDEEDGGGKGGDMHA
ncbi:uncharacterized protein LOC113279316 [Papaver somniferum]|uniref:uncharacterized protein LOC113279316 n=1 Tax=Papaver somniferum TaxID=3469 RepID=UPI000E6F5E2A|nr:uncharacterized protein LOC113279316 [Papaver somniferum]